MVSKSVSEAITFQTLIWDKWFPKAFLGQTLSKSCSGTIGFSQRFCGKNIPTINLWHMVSNSVSGKKTLSKNCSGTNGFQKRFWEKHIPKVDLTTNY